MCDATTLKGLDVYHGDTPLDYHAMAAAGGVSFCFIKATQGDGYVDPNFRDNYARSKSVGMLTGAYHFFDPNADPVQQAHHLINNAPLASGDLVYCLDVETDGWLVGGKAFSCAHELKQATGRWPIIYSGRAFYQDRLESAFPSHLYTLWIAEYGRKPSVSCDFWQYTDAGRIPGNPHPLDTDVFYGTRADLLTHCLP